MTAARLIVSPEAEADLNAILDYLVAHAGRPIALRYAEDFRRSFLHVAEFPDSGSPRPQFGNTMRLWVVAPYLIFYRHAAGEDIVRIVRILHGHREVTERLLGPA